MGKLAIVILVSFIVIRAPAWQPDRPNPGIAAIQDFEKRIEQYEQIHKSAESGLPALKPTHSPEEIKKHERELAAKIREARVSAKQGDIFTPEITVEFRQRIAAAMTGPQAGKIKQSLKHAEPQQRRVQVNGTPPTQLPLPSTPPSLLLNLPKLPDGIEYRVIGKDLALVDVPANLIIDLIPMAIL
jgi:hypothetical protein